jgi:hypothetical protein
LKIVKAIKAIARQLHTITQETGQHKLSTVADSVDSAVLDNETLVASEQSLEGSNDSAEVGLVPGVVHSPLSIQNIVEGNEVLGLVHGTRAHTSELLHVGTDTKQQTQVHAQGSDIGTSLAAHPEDTQVAVIVKLNQLALVDGSNTKLSLDGGNQRWALEQGTGEGLEGAGELGLAARQLVVETNDGNVLLSGSLLGLDQSSRSIDTDNQTSRDLGVKGTAVTGLLNTNGCAPHMAIVSSMIQFQQ